MEGLDIDLSYHKLAPQEHEQADSDNANEKLVMEAIRPGHYPVEEEEEDEDDDNDNDEEEEDGPSSVMTAKQSSGLDDRGLWPGSNRRKVGSLREEALQQPQRRSSSESQDSTDDHETDEDGNDDDNDVNDDEEEEDHYNVDLSIPHNVLHQPPHHHPHHPHHPHRRSHHLRRDPPTRTDSRELTRLRQSPQQHSVSPRRVILSKVSVDAFSLESGDTILLQQAPPAPPPPPTEASTPFQTREKEAASNG